MRGIEWAVLIAGLSICGSVIAAEIDPGVFEPYTKAGFPKTFAKWGTAGVKKIDKYRVLAAKAAATSDRCDRVDVAELSDSRSSPPANIVIFVDCANGERFYLSSAELDAGNATKSNKEKTSQLSDPSLIETCRAATQRALTFPSSYSEAWTAPKVYRAPQGNVAVTIEFTAKNELGIDVPQQSRCVTDDRGMHQPEVSNR